MLETKDLSSQLFLKTIESLGINTQTAKDLGIAIDSYYLKPSISFDYQNLSKQPTNYKVHRLHDNFVNIKQPKYTNQAGSNNQYFFNGINVFSPKNEETIYFTEGQKKAISLCIAGVYAVGVSGIFPITKSIKNEKGFVVDYLANENYTNFTETVNYKNQVLFLDTDFREHKTTKRLKNFQASVKSFKLVSNRTYKEPFLACLTAKCNAKAFDDLKDLNIKEQVVKGLKELKTNEYVTIFRLNDFSAREIDLIVSGNLKLNEYFLTEKYISDDKVLTDLLGKSIDNSQNLLIRATTGKGKTKWLIDYCKREIDIKNMLGEDDKIVIVLPKNTLIDSLYDNFPKELQEKTFVLNQETTIEEKINLGFVWVNTNLVITTYESYHKIAPLLKKNDIVFYDEFHYPIASNLVDNEFHEAYKITPCKKIHLTATPILEFHDLYRAEVIYISDYIEKPKNILNVWKSEKNIENTISDFISKLSKKSNDLHVVFIQNKELIESFTRQYSVDFEVQGWYSEDCVKEKDYYKEFLKTGQFQKTDNKPLLILATSFIYEGVSFTNPNVTTVSIFSETNPLNIVQALNRMRLATLDTVYNLFVSNKKTTNFPKCFEKYKEVLTNYNILHNNPVGINDKPLLEHYYLLKGTFTDNYIKNGLCWFYHSGHYAKNFYTQDEILSKEFTVLPTQNYEFSEEFEGIKSNKQSKEDKLQHDKIAYDLLISDPQKAINLVFSNTENRELRKYLKQEHQANYAPNSEYSLRVVSLLHDYYSLFFKLSIVLKNTEIDILTIWNNKSDRKSKTFLEQIIILQYVQIGKKSRAKDIVGKQDAEHIFITNHIYKFLHKLRDDGELYQHKEIYKLAYNDLIDNYKEHKLLKKNKLQISHDRVKNIVNSLIDINFSEKKNNKKYYKISIK